MMVKILPTILFPILTLLTSVSPLRSEEMFVKAGEMVVLRCLDYISHNPNDDTKLVWRGYTAQEMYVIDSMSSAEQKQMLILGTNLVILIATVNHQGNYSCSLGNTSKQFRLKVYTTQSTNNEEKNRYSKRCNMQESCTLNCPDEHAPDVKNMNMTSNSIIWHKQGDPLPKNGYFSSVKKEDHGVYTCTRSYLFHDRLYNMTFTVVLDVQPKGKSGNSMIVSPNKGQVFDVALGSVTVIDCKAVVYSDFDEVFWLSDTSFVEINDSFPVFYNYTREDNSKEISITASLVFKKVSEKDLSRRYTCKLDSVADPSSFVTITLASKAHDFSLFLSLSIVGILVVIIAIVVYVKFKIHITLFLRDTLGCRTINPDGKRYDVFLVCYKSETDAGLNEDNRQWLENVLEDRFGYSLCLYDRNITLAKAEAEAVLDCIEQSRTVVLVPASSDCGLGSDMLSEIHAALVKWQSHLVFIKTEKTKMSTSGSLPEAFERLGKAADFVTWKCTSSVNQSSSFLKQLWYYLPAPRHPPKITLLPQTATQYDNC